MHKYIVSVLIIVLVLSSSSVILPASLALTKPSTPTFTIEEISTSYDVPPTYEKDPYTGETITKPGYTTENKNTYIKIKNQPFTPVTKDDGSYVKLYYQYRYKGHYSDNNEWQTPPYSDYSFEQSINSEYTLIYLALYRAGAETPHEGDKFDVQVRAVIYSRTAFEVTWGRPHTEYNDEQIESAWSSTQTVTYKSTDRPATSHPSSTSPTNSDSSTSNQFESEKFLFGLSLVDVVLVVLFSVIVVLLVFVVVHLGSVRY